MDFKTASSCCPTCYECEIDFREGLSSCISCYNRHPDNWLQPSGREMNDSSHSKKPKHQAKPWSGRFSEATDKFVESFTASVEFDKRLYQQDINGSIAHAKMLQKVGVLSTDELKKITDGLESIRKDIADGKFQWSVALEDVHMNIEAALTELIGDTGKKLHTGRSRNDQVATDLRLYVRDGIDVITDLICKLQSAIVNLAEKESSTIMPGFTHLQTAQPVTFGHHMLAWFEMLERDYERFIDCRKRVNQSPLGAAALAGTSYPIDREFTAALLGFDTPTANSLDSVSDLVPYLNRDQMMLYNLQNKVLPRATVFQTGTGRYPD